MSKELKILAINNVTFKEPLSSRKSFKKYKETKKEDLINEWKNSIRDSPILDLIEDGIAKRVIRLDIGSGISIKETKEG